MPCVCRQHCSAPAAACLQAFNGAWPSCLPVPHAMCLVFVRCVGALRNCGMGWGGRLGRARRNAPCQGRSSGRRRSRRRYACWRCWRLPGVSWGSETSRCSTICAGSRLPWAFGRTISRALTKRTITNIGTHTTCIDCDIRNITILKLSNL